MDFFINWKNDFLKKNGNSGKTMLILFFILLHLNSEVGTSKISKSKIDSSIAEDKSSSVRKKSTTTTVAYPPPNFRSPNNLINYVFTENFYYLVVYNEIFVDKTLFIAEFLKLRGRLFAMLRPRKWSKSVNLHMLKLFLEIEVDVEDGTPIAEERQINRKLFVGGEIETAPIVKRKQLKPLKIAQQQPEIVKRHQGQHPVLYFSFSAVYGDTYDEIEDRLKSEVQFWYDQYDYLANGANNNNLTADEREKFERYTESNVTSDLLQDSLRFLSELLYKHFNKTIYVLIDDYDAPIRQLYHAIGKSLLNQSSTGANDTTIDYRHLCDELDRTLQLICPMYKDWLQFNPRIEKTLIMGTFRANDADLLTYLRGPLLEYDLLDDRFSKYFGFTRDDFDELSAQLPFPVDWNAVDNWYKGYLCGSQMMYNPWSIMQYLDRRCEFGHYWLDYNETNVSPDDGMFLADVFRSDLKRLATGQHIQLNITIRDVHLVDGFDRIGFVHLLLFTGYLTPALNEKSMYNLTVPNKEVNRLYEAMYKIAASDGR